MSEVNQQEQGSDEHELKFYRNSISWRRNLVLQMLSEGHNQSHISRVLKVHRSTISIDVQFLREQTRNQMKEFVTERLPMAITKSCTALDSITARAWELARDTEDDRIRLQALTLIKETEKDKIDIVSNVNIVDQIITQTEQRQQAQQDPYHEFMVRGEGEKEDTSAEFGIGGDGEKEDPQDEFNLRGVKEEEKAT